MSTAVLPPQRIPITDENGVLRREWALYFIQSKQSGTDNSARLDEIATEARQALITSNQALSNADAAQSTADEALLDTTTKTHESLVDVLGWTTGTGVTTDKHISQAQGKVWQDHVEITNANPHGTDHSQLDSIGTADETDSNTTKDKHVSNAQLKTLQDHVNITAGNPHGRDFGVSPDLTKFGADGHQTMEGAARPWRDELTDALLIRSTGAGVSSNSTENTVDFTSTAQIANDYLYLNIQLNHDKDLSSSIYPHIHFFQGSNAVPNFLVEYRWQINGAEKVTSWTSIVCNTMAHTYSGTTKNNIAHSAAISVPTGAALSDIVQFRIARDTDNDSGLFAGADPYAGTVSVLAFDVHFMLNSIGSNDEYVK